jgi:DNA repair protein RadC
MPRAQPVQLPASMSGSSLLREMPVEERPRQRLLRGGGDALADPEVLSLILGSGCRGVCALELAREILTETGGLTGLVGMRPDTLQRRGLGEAKAAAVLAALELARRLARSEVPRRLSMKRPFRVASYLSLRYGLRDQEAVGALFLDVRNRLLGEAEIARGTLDRALIEPRQILWPALARGAAGVVIFHNHPSGDPTPSLEDVKFTRRMAAACDAVGVKLIDHLILGSAQRWVSLRERGRV